jgi:glucosamine--fructose-6-phosphate aminotransferase (isomerizing)
MCGIFGTLRPRRYTPTTRHDAAAALLTLGALAEERGTDSAGIATLHNRPLTTRTNSDAELVDRAAGRTRIVITLSPFSVRIPSACRIAGSLRSANLVLGHTRWATQGLVDLSNCSPMIVDAVLGTHNGDVTVPYTDGAQATETDSAWLFSQLSPTTTVATAAAVLTRVRGRAALAWINAVRPGSLFLARAALSPLAVAQDSAGALWWASNPAWLRKVGYRHHLGMSDPQMVPEGSAMEFRAADDHVDMVAFRRFTATSRVRDQHLDHAIWRGFSTRDRNFDLTRSDRRHVARGAVTHLPKGG